MALDTESIRRILFKDTEAHMEKMIMRKQIEIGIYKPRIAKDS